MNYILLSIFSILSFSAFGNPPLTIEVSNIQFVRVEIVIGLFNSDKDFLKDDAYLKKYTIPVTQTTETIIIEDLPEGSYAVSLFHDENSDKKCNRSFLGIPTESYGFSNNIKPKFSAPIFEKCKFFLREKLNIKIKLLD